MTKVRNGPKCASIGLAHEAFVGVRHSSTFSRLAQRRMAGVLFAERLSRFCARLRYVPRGGQTGVVVLLGAGVRGRAAPAWGA